MEFGYFPADTNSWTEFAALLNVKQAEHLLKKEMQYFTELTNTSSQATTSLPMGQSLSSNSVPLTCDMYDIGYWNNDTQDVAADTKTFSVHSHKPLARSRSDITKSSLQNSLEIKDKICPRSLSAVTYKQKLKLEHINLEGTARDPTKAKNTIAPKTSTENLELHGTAVNGSSVMVNGGNGEARYKTELCRTFEESGKCKYGDKCQFAHGRAELRNLTRHPKYKTDRCKTYHSTGFCPYGSRCHFIHDDDERATQSPDEPLFLQQEKLLETLQRQQLERKQQLKQLQQQLEFLQQKLLRTIVSQKQEEEKLSRELLNSFLANYSENIKLQSNHNQPQNLGSPSFNSLISTTTGDYNVSSSFQSIHSASSSVSDSCPPSPSLFSVEEMTGFSDSMPSDVSASQCYSTPTITDWSQPIGPKLGSALDQDLLSSLLLRLEIPDRNIECTSLPDKLLAGAPAFCNSLW